MKTFSTVEDYLEVISGKRNQDGSLPTNNTILFLGFHEFKPIVSLARYDVNFLDSVTDATLGGAALTDRQAELALRIINKYSRQLGTHQISVDSITQTPAYRKPLRIIDRSKRVDVKNGEIIIQFPYEQKLIDGIREQAKDSQGRVRFDKEDKAWKVGLTEYNVNWVHAFAEQHQFSIGTELADAMQQIINVEHDRYAIELVIKDNCLHIENATASMLEYFDNEHNMFDIGELANLVDQSSVIGYTVHDTVSELYNQQFGSDISIMLRSRTYDFKDHNWPNFESSILKYAQLVNRFPIVVFDPQANFGNWQQIADPNQVIDLCKVKADQERQVCQNTQAQIILCNRAVKYLDCIPLLVTHMGMIVGQDKRIMLDASEKVFYRNGKLA
jgi:hypothetical protein